MNHPPLKAKFLYWAHCDHAPDENETYLTINGVKYTHWNETKEAQHDSTEPQHVLMPLEEMARMHWRSHQGGE